MRGLLFIALGFLAGNLSGLIGIGGGVLIVPVLVFLFGFNQQLAEGTTLAAMVPPIGILAAYVYFRAGFVDIPAALFIALGFIVGGFIGARFATSIEPLLLQRIFGAIMLVIGVRMLFGALAT